MDFNQFKSAIQTHRSNCDSGKLEYAAKSLVDEDFFSKSFQVYKSLDKGNDISPRNYMELMPESVYHGQKILWEFLEILLKAEGREGGHGAEIIGSWDFAWSLIGWSNRISLTDKREDSSQEEYFVDDDELVLWKMCRKLLRGQFSDCANLLQQISRDKDDPKFDSLANVSELLNELLGRLLGLLRELSLAFQSKTGRAASISKHSESFLDSYASENLLNEALGAMPTTDGASGYQKYRLRIGGLPCERIKVLLDDWRTNQVSKVEQLLSSSSGLESLNLIKPLEIILSVLAGNPVHWIRLIKECFSQAGDLKSAEMYPSWLDCWLGLVLFGDAESFNVEIPYDGLLFNVNIKQGPNKQLEWAKSIIKKHHESFDKEFKDDENYFYANQAEKFAIEGDFLKMLSSLAASLTRPSDRLYHLWYIAHLTDWLDGGNYLQKSSKHHKEIIDRIDLRLEFILEYCHELVIVAVNEDRPSLGKLSLSYLSEILSRNDQRNLERIVELLYLYREILFSNGSISIDENYAEMSYPCKRTIKLIQMRKRIADNQDYCKAIGHLLELRIDQTGRADDYVDGLIYAAIMELLFLSFSENSSTSVKSTLLDNINREIVEPFSLESHENAGFIGFVLALRNYLAETLPHSKSEPSVENWRSGVKLLLELLVILGTTSKYKLCPKSDSKYEHLMPVFEELDRCLDHLDIQKHKQPKLSKIQDNIDDWYDILRLLVNYQSTIKGEKNVNLFERIRRKCLKNLALSMLHKSVDY